MLLRLVPPNPTQPSVAFAVAFKPVLPEGVSIPQAWAGQLQQVLQDGLETPESIHALDKAAWGVSLLQEVNFNAALRIIHCLFTDGTRMDWPILDGRCLHILHSVMQDVNTSFHAAHQERDHAQPKEVGFFPSFSRPSSPAPVKPKFHRRSRSFLMSLVASLVPSSRPSSPVQSDIAEYANFDPEPEPEVVSNTDQKGTLRGHREVSRSRLLRRRARATLIDAFRRYILPQLNSPFRHGGYPFWIIRSSLYNIEARMQYLVQTSGIDFSSMVRNSQSRMSPSLLSESPSGDDDSLTDTDGSSVHTPADSFGEHPFFYQAAVNDEDQFVDLESGLPRTPSPSSPPTSGDSKSGPAAEYALLYASTSRLRALLDRTQSSENTSANEISGLLAILEVKSRRRAWSTKALNGGALAHLSGLGTPIRSSPLARFPPTTPESLAKEARFLSVPRAERSKLGPKRLSTIKEKDNSVSFPVDVKADEDDGFEIRVPRNRTVSNCIPFPQTEDFCCTAPQDPLPLFGPIEREPDAADADFCAIYRPDDFDASSQIGCDAFALALDIQPKPAQGHRRIASAPMYECDGWISSNPLVCR